MRPLPILFTAMLILAACGTDSTSDAGASSTTIPVTTAPTAVPTTEPTGESPHRATWEAQSIGDYAYTYVRFCECPDDARGPFRVIVKDGRVDRVESFGQPTDADGQTIDEIFDAVAATIADGKSTDVSYHPTLGHPISVDLDLEAIAVDGGYSIEITSFTDLAQPAGALFDAQARWAEAGIQNYRMTYRQICFCPQIVRTVVVENGTVVETIDEGDVVLEEPGHTVESLYADLDIAIRAPVFSLQATYDPILGYPTDLYVDVEEFMADEEWGLQVESFEILD